jgi:hypothetical protein
MYWVSDFLCDIRSDISDFLNLTEKAHICGGKTIGIRHSPPGNGGTMCRIVHRGMIISTSREADQSLETLTNTVKSVEIARDAALAEKATLAEGFETQARELEQREREHSELRQTVGCQQSDS